MISHRYLLSLAALPLLGVQPLLAATVQVGGCLTGPPNFTTISLAVTSPSSSTVEVCPGTYPEQVTISHSLTLVGVPSGTANQAVITVPSAGLVQNTVSMFSEPVAAQVLVTATTGTVNITNITVDGTGGNMSCAGNLWLAGIFYGSGSSGIVNLVRASGQINGTCGVGIWAENGHPSSKTVTVENSTVYSVDSAGIFAGSGSTPSLTANLNSNVVNASANGNPAVAAIDSDSVHGQVNGNDLSNSVFGVYDLSTITVQSNTIIGMTTAGIYMGNGGTASNNEISGSSEGVLLGAAGATLTNNVIMSSTTAGVEMGCFSASVTGNVINDAPIGIDAAPTTLGSNTLANTPTTITNGCAAAAVRAAPANLSNQWHTPATPNGKRTR